jgi:membrane protein
VIFKKISERLLKIKAVQLIVSTVMSAGSHQIGHMAAGIAYYAFLSIFPLILGIIAVLGYFLPSTNLQNILLDFVASSLPVASNVLQQNMASIIELRGPMGLSSIIILFWSGSAMFSAIDRVINTAWGILSIRPFFIRKARDLGMVIGISLLFLISLGINTAIPIVRDLLGIATFDSTIASWSARGIAFILLFVSFLLLYKFNPNIRIYWIDIWPGALFAAIFFEIARTLFVIYFDKLANYELVYGSIASIIALLVWIYYSAFILILGAEFTSQYKQMRKDMTKAVI